ncbi:hypothetical protein [Desulfobulbus alkaliphilus]|uniref:hypothetical protein n=1 Tax=Desulfobulbus alkaliphilus TaxID=869814 RepID=UPI00196366F0|nr:hypothetical protein [Desulfobulbus alkaliphilus]MBM9535715.1 hypothetical protein [Desulfobulbus alkaliphilus]
MMKNTWEKILEYASMPLHGTLSRKLRNGVALQINEGKRFERAVIFLGESFIRITEEENSQILNSYYDWNAIQSIRTFSPKESKEK